MRAILAALTNIATRTGRLTVSEVNELYNGLWRIVLYIGLACVAAFILNAFGGTFAWRAPSLVLAIGFAIVAMYVWAKPIHVLVIVGAGGAWGVTQKILGDATLADEVGKVLEKYADFLKWVLLVVLTFLLFAGTISFKENPGAVLPLLVALAVIGLFTWMWPTIFVGTLGRRLVYGYAVVIVAISFGSLIPNAVWYKYTGWMPERLEATSADRAAAAIVSTDENIRATNAAKEIRMIEERIIREGRPMTDPERSRVETLTRSAPVSKTGTQTQPSLWYHAPDLQGAQPVELLFKSNKEIRFVQKGPVPVHWIGQWVPEARGWEGVCIQDKKEVCTFRMREAGAGTFKMNEFSADADNPYAPREQWKEKEVRFTWSSAI